MFQSPMTSSQSSSTEASPSEPLSPQSEAPRLVASSPTTNASVDTAAPTPPSLLDAFSVSSVLNPGFGFDKQQFYAPLESTARHRPSTPHLLSSLAKELPHEYLLRATSYLDPSQQSSLFNAPNLNTTSHPLQMSSPSYADSIASSRALSPRLIGSDRMAAVSSLRACANPYGTSSLDQADEASKFLSAMQPHSSSSSSSMHSHLPPALSAQYESSYRSFGRRMHEMHNSTSVWKSMYSGGQSSSFESEPESSSQSHYINPPPAHHNTSTGRYLSPSSSYTVPTPLVSPSSYLLSSLSAGGAAALSGHRPEGASLSVEPSTGRKYTRRSTTTNKIPETVKETDEYKMKRERNNIAVRKSREKAKRRLKENESRAHELIIDNEQLRNRIKILSNMLQGLRVLLNTCGVSQEKINFEISKTIDIEHEPSDLNMDSIFAKMPSKVSSTHSFAHPPATGHDQYH